MRTEQAAGLAFIEQAILRHIYIESADPGDMQRRVAAKLAELAADQDHLWRVAFIALAGAGDGHTFVTQLDLGDANDSGHEVVDGLLPGDMTVFYFMAAQSEALTAARDALRPAIADLVTANGAQTLLQTLLAGASQGTRCMGGVLLVPAL